MNLLLLLLIGGLMHAARTFSVSAAPATGGVALAFGYVMLTAFFAGRSFKDLHLPRLTGYLAAGIAVGPAGLGLVTESMLDSLKLVNGMAIALIALTAGTELELVRMRPLLRTIGWLSLVAVGGTTLLLALAAFLARGLLPFMARMTLAQAGVVALVLGAVMVAQSPAVVVALRDELKSEGPVTSTVLGVVVVADLVVILLFAFFSAVAKGVFGAELGALATARALAWELVGSMVAGAGIGALLAAYLRWIRRGTSIFLLAVAFVVAEVGQRLGFDPLLLALAAGVLVRNLTGLGGRLHQEVEASAMPVYIVFFAVAGASIHLGVLKIVGLPVLLFVGVRAAGFLVGNRVGAALAGAPEPVRRYAGFGLLPQAGLALALSLLFAKIFPEFGAEAGALTLGVVAVNELMAPVLYRIALIRSGEAGRSATAAEPSPGH